MIPISPRRALLAAPALVLTLVFLATPAQAQYLYLDSNGDGVHTAADVLSGTGTTTVDLWIDTAHNRDGSVAVCDTEPGTEMTINSYVIVLHASGGSVVYGTPVNRRPEMPTHIVTLRTDQTDLIDGWGGGTIDPPGLYRLWTVPVTVASGTPSLGCVQSTPLWYEWTSFGCRCSGHDFDNTYKLGSDFFDTDGLAYSPGGGPNSAPVLDQPVDMIAATGETTSQTLTARDAEGNEIHFAKDAGPNYVWVFTTDPGRGVGTGRVTVRPSRTDLGSSAVTVSATDGLETVRATFQVTVVAGPNHAPSLTLPATIRVEAGAVGREQIYARDVDGDAVTLYKAAGPDFVSVESPGGKPGAILGSVLVAPGTCDIGTAEVTVGATDGLLSVDARLSIIVMAPRPVPTPAVRTFGAVPTPYALIEGDWNEDGHLDMASVADGSFGVSVLLGDGDGDLRLQWSQKAGRLPTCIATGDWDRDGHLDLVVGGWMDSLVVFAGLGDGNFVRGRAYPVPTRMDAIQSADFNDDGLLDLAMSGDGYTVAFGVGDGSFVFGPLEGVTGRSPSLVIGDFDLDGIEDIALAAGTSIAMRLGRGDGSFLIGPTTPVEEPPFTLASADLNGDGILDLVGFGAWQSVRTYLGDGLGGFTMRAAVVPREGSGPWTGDLADWDGDGCADAITSTFDIGILFALRGDRQGGLADTPMLTIGQPGSVMGVAAGDFNEDGRSDIAYGSSPYLALALNTRPPKSAAIARTFLMGGANALPTVPSARQVSFYIEPISGGFDILSLDLSTVRLHSEGTGSVTSIAPSAGKAAVVGDVDENGVQEVAVHFAAADLSKLFDRIHGRQEAPVSLDGALYAGGTICSRFTLNLVGTGPRELAVTVAPNPLNPNAVLSFETTKPGAVQVRLFDIHGRLLRVLFDTPMAEPSRFALPIDGMDGGGRRLATGVYFFRVNAEGVERRGRFVVLK